jgi:hypothetical protein
LTIPPDDPVTFKTSEVDDRLKVDLFCQLQMGEASPDFIVQNVVVRVWTDDPALGYRPDWDSPDVWAKSQRSGSFRRVMLRLHFDRAAPTDRAPTFHLQVGGHVSAPEDEVCWHPRTMDVPRVPVQPAEVALAAEMILASFFPQSYETIRRDPEWCSIVRRAEATLQTHYRTCIGYIERSDKTQTLFQQLWNG